jgi:enamine deaminase RidA (YjgF/YER057c/UK114 family)
VSVAEKLKTLGLEIPKRSSVGSYVGAVQAGDLVFVSGGGPMKADGSFVTGKVGADVSVEQAKEAAKLCALYCLASVQEAIGDLNKVERVVKLLGFVNSAPGFVEQHVVMNGASDLLIELFGESGRHARSSVGMAELPMNIAVEVEMIVQVS